MPVRFSPIVVVITLGILTFGYASSARELDSIILDEDDRVCWRIYGSMNTMQDCLLRANSEIVEFVARRVEWIKESLKNNTKAIQLLNDAQNAWKNTKDSTCNSLIWKKYEEGSLQRTEPLRCHFYVQNDRYRMLDILYNTIKNNISLLRNSNLYNYEKICWNIYGFNNNEKCLREYLKLAKKSMNGKISIIFEKEVLGNQNNSNIEFHNSQKKWELEKEKTCNLFVVASNTNNKEIYSDSISLWCKYLMTRDRERLLLRLYELNLHQIGISVRQ